MPNIAKITPIGEQSATIQPEQPQEEGRNKLPEESALWYRRYCLYRDLGHKRSLKAAVSKERETAHMVKESEKALQSTQKLKRKTPATQKTPLAPAPVIQVPGSWKQACKTYRWVERAKSFDVWLLRGMAKGTYEHLGATYANKYKRVAVLDSTIKSVFEQLSGALKEGTSHKNYLAYIKQIAALLEQMNKEVSGHDDEMQLAIEAYGKSLQDEIEQAYHGGETKIIKKA